MAHVVVVGAGGVGGYFAGLLAEAGHQVTLLARGETLVAAASGIRIEEAGAPSRLITGVRVVAKLDGVAAADLALVCVKSWQIAEAAALLEPVIAAHTVVVPVQNGVDSGDRLAAAFGVRRAVGGVCFVVAIRTAPDTFASISVAPSMELGSLAGSDGGSADRLADIAAILTGAGVASRVVPDIRRSLWRKLMFISSFGGVSTLSDSPAGEVRSSPRTWALLESALNEVAAVARAVSAGVTDGDIERAVRQVHDMAPEVTSSMQRDIAAGRPSELFDQNGAVVRYGEWLGVATPVHSVIYGALLPRELRTRGESDEPPWSPPVGAPTL